MMDTATSTTEPQVTVQIATADENIPSDEEFRRWVAQVLPKHKQHFELTIRVVGLKESQSLNAQFRNKDKPTNVLSFPSDLPEGIDIPLLGDLVVCAPVVEAEAREQNKSLGAHWAHMVVHGTLHLLGYDHEDESEAEAMESLETQILNALNFPAPYE